MTKKSTVNKAGNYTKPTMRKNIFNRIKLNNNNNKTRGHQGAESAASQVGVCHRAVPGRAPSQAVPEVQDRRQKFG